MTDSEEPRLGADQIRQAFHVLYMREYTRLVGVTGSDIARWSLVTAAARMGEGIAVEQAALLRRISGEMERRRKSGAASSTP